MDRWRWTVGRNKTSSNNTFICHGKTTYPNIQVKYLLTYSGFYKCQNSISRQEKRKRERKKRRPTEASWKTSNYRSGKEGREGNVAPRRGSPGGGGRCPLSQHRLCEWRVSPCLPAGRRATRLSSSPSLLSPCLLYLFYRFIATVSLSSPLPPYH